MKIEEIDYEYDFEPPKDLNINESYAMVYSILRDVLQENIGIEMWDPYIYETKIIKAKPKTFKQLDKEFNKREKDAHMIKKNKVPVKKNHFKKQEKVMMIDHANANPCVQAKIVVEWQPHKERAHAKEVAIALEEMLQAAVKGEEDFTLGDRYEPKLIMNDALRQREEWESNYKAVQEKKRKKRAERQEYLKAKIEQKKEELEKSPPKKIRKYKSKHIRYDGKKMSKSQVQDLQEYRKKQDEKLEEYRNNIKEAKERNKKEIRRKKREEKDQLKKAFEDFNKKKIETMGTKFQKMSEVRKSRASKMKTYDQVKKEIKVANKESVRLMMEKNKVIQEEKKKREEFIKEVTGNQLYQNFRDRHDTQFRTLFDFYYNYLFLEEKKYQSEPMIPLNLFNKFCFDFSLVPILLKPREHVSYSKQVFGTKAKSTERINTLGINFEEFKTYCLFIIQKKENMKILKQIYKLGHKQTLSTKPEEVGDPLVFTPPEEAVSKKILKAMMEKHEALVKKRDEKIQRNYIREVKNTPISSLEGFMVYMEIHEDHDEVIQDIIKHQNKKSLPNRILIQSKNPLKFFHDFNFFLEKLGLIQQQDEDVSIPPQSEKADEEGEGSKAESQHE